MKITLSNSVLSRIGMTNQTGCPMEGGGGGGGYGKVRLGLKFSIL